MSSTELQKTDEVIKQLDDYIIKLEEGHRMHRKIKFLLDIRGLLVINKMTGDYVEFGIYRGEMMYSAAKIIGKWINRFIGLDTFAGLPKPLEGDDKLFVFESWGFMACPKVRVEEIMKGFNTLLIEGDFRDGDVTRTFREQAKTISVLTIDCNWPSSVEAALHMSAPYLRSGSIIFIDDYFVATKYPNFNDPILKEVTCKNGFRLVEFMTYPPSARAFIVEAQDK
jgi:hypothetical protein